MTTAQQTAQDFMKIAHKFHLGCLPTQQQSPITIGMAEMAQSDIPNAIAMIKKLDSLTLSVLKSKIPQLQNMYKQINNTLENGGRIFICGCGATGRLSIVLQTLWRQQTACIYPEWKQKVIAFMAGGDAALIKSIQDFQDHPEFAQQHLIQLGFRQGDLLIGSTQGGETSWVIGAVWASTKISERKPFCLYCNPDDILIQKVERSKQFILSSKVIKINCTVGQMGLAGSTRMQATTILMHAIGIALLGCDRMRQIRKQQDWVSYANNNINALINYFQNTDFSNLSEFVQYQATLYKQGKLLSYLTNQYYAVSILTDTTQRSPTFSLTPFINVYQPQDKQSWCNLTILHDKQIEQNLTPDQRAEKDWQEMLGNREIRGLNSSYWQKYKQKVSNNIIFGFYLNNLRDNYIKITYPLTIQIYHQKQLFKKFTYQQYPSKCRLSHHSFLKMLLNNVSTVIMGRLSRYSSNIMTYVKPTNYKLIDRAARYVLYLRPKTTYEQAVRAIYHLKYKISLDEPIVLKVIEYLDSL